VAAGEDGFILLVEAYMEFFDTSIQSSLDIQGKDRIPERPKEIAHIVPVLDLNRQNKGDSAKRIHRRYDGTGCCD